MCVLKLLINNFSNTNKTRKLVLAAKVPIARNSFFCVNIWLIILKNQFRLKKNSKSPKHGFFGLLSALILSLSVPWTGNELVSYAL